MKRTSQGRKKIEIKKIEELTSRQVTFSKRRAGLFNKAGELCVLTGAETAIIIQSQAGRLFAFGHPSVESVVDHYVTGVCSPEQAPGTDVSPESMQAKLNQQYSEISKELEAEKDGSGIIEDKSIQEGGGSFWWEDSFEELEVEELERYINSMEELKKNVDMRANEVVVIKASSSMFDTNHHRSNDPDLNERLADDVISHGYVGHG